MRQSNRISDMPGAPVIDRLNPVFRIKPVLKLKPVIRITCLLVLPLLVFLLFVPRTVSAAIKFSEAQLIANGQQLLLDATASIELNPSIESGLSSGVPLYFNATIEISQANRWWLDTTLHKQVYRYSLVYYELTRHYRVSWLDESRSRNFRSLLDALDSIGTVRRLPLNLVEPLDGNETYQASLRLSLDQNALPLALRPLVFVNSGWRLESEEYQWQLN